LPQAVSLMSDQPETQPLHLLDWPAERLTDWCKSAGLPGYRAGQILEWVYEHAAESFEQMTNLPKLLRSTLAEQWRIYESRVAAVQASADGTVKLLLAWSDEQTTECVLIPEPKRNTACISSQVGCPVGCAFCASGLGGLKRNLTAGQIVEQVLRVRQQVPEGQRLSHVVFMGLGEPLGNYEPVVAAVRTLNAAWGPNISARRITISTVGLPSQIRRLADEGLPVNLAISVHAPNDALRKQLIPWAKSVQLSQLVAAGRHWFSKTGREITLEYILLAGVNDGPEHAEQLARLAGQLRANVNLIRYHPVEGLPFTRPSGKATAHFQSMLREKGVNAHTRKSRGLDIDAACGACGQLRRRERTATLPNEGHEPQ
jgi:23S rRNA (adenine2503-C2)-methyltransferase